MDACVRQFPAEFQTLEARYVKITVQTFRECIALRAGIISTYDLSLPGKVALPETHLNEYKLRAFYRKYKPEKESSAVQVLNSTLHIDFYIVHALEH